MQILDYIQEPWKVVILLAISLLPFFRIAHNSFFMRPIEKLRLTESERLTVQIAQWLTLSALIGTAIFTLVLDGVSVGAGGDSEISWKLIAGLSYSLAVFFVTLLLLFVYGFFSIFSVKTSFHIVDEEPLEVVKKVNKHTYLLQAKDGGYLFYSRERLNHVKFHEELCHPPKYKSLLSQLYSWRKTGFLITVVINLAITASLFFNYFVVSWWLILILMFVLLVYGTIVKNYETIQRLSSDKSEMN
ncbi:hypothetical protein [Sporosarcina sp. P32b]|uniref:hypothetical protein n=1 Tax=Sporosarcina sp. P32b TaxID=2048248 RepID=UPI000C16CAD9|nr:hypothetical protein [Sporosarcina sp. P32b]PID04687.1 hypothetical protein CSV66_13515 [Sporosarcina sp. P30]PID08080.1 hypothetical protein CSV65_12455 [Sporosarcina sp. P31]PID11027.1 hypothetical protein CSV64_13750 [Sporosarcina sp. P32b]